ncbi:MAG: phosphatidylserine decarboxylase [Halomonadaceae bacterium]|nr:MAG: phosphatidylserine decarboxylase [Halomonadaceae bacterium]
MRESLFILAQKLAPQHLLSRAAGLVANNRWPWFKNAMVRWFIRRYQVDMAEAAEPDPQAYASFNAFFTRALKPGVRPLDSNPRALLCPADGAISQIGGIHNGSVLQAKGQTYSLSQLLAEPAEQLQAFDQGSFVTVYLSPRDYHRVHMPLAGTLTRTTFVPGDLFSVNPVTAQRVPGLFARNERLVTWFDTEVGPVALVLVGAMVVASMATVWGGTVAPGGKQLVVTDFTGDQAPRLERGAEMGRFMLGSTAILVLPSGAGEWLDHYRSGTAVRMGETLGQLTRAEQPEAQEQA